MMADTGAALPAATARRRWRGSPGPRFSSGWCTGTSSTGGHRGALPVVGRPPGLPLPAGGGCRRRHPGHAGQHPPALGLHLLLPLLPARVRRSRRRLLAGGPPAPALGGREPPQRTARRRGVGQYDQRRPHRPLHPPGSDGRPARCSDSLMGREPYETHPYDVLVIGAGGAGLRAAIEAAARGARTAVICQSLLRKAHTAMAEGAAAAAVRNVWA